MNKKFRILAALMSLALCFGLLTACGSNNNSTGNNSGGSTVTDNDNTQNNNTEDSGTEEDLSVNTVAQVTAIHEDGSLELKIYSGSGEISDFAAVDFSGYTATEETETLTISDESVLFTAENGALNAASLSDIAVGDMLVLTRNMDTDALQQAVRYAAADQDSGTEGTEDSGTDTGADSSTDDTAA